MEDMMRLDLKTPFMKLIVAKLLKNLIKDKTGVNVDIILDHMDVIHSEGQDVHADMHLVVSMKETDISKIL